MDFPDESQPADLPYADGTDVRVEALGVVRDAHQWRLAAERWQVVEQALIAMAAAVAADDPYALAAATAELELVGPLRILRISATAVAGPTPQVQDRLNQLVYSLGGVTPGQQPARDTGNGEDDASGH